MRSGTADLLRDQGRGFVGALLIGVPLLYTMETWWLGWRLPLLILIAFAASGLVLVMVLVRVAGFRRDGGPDTVKEWAREFTELVLQSTAAGALVLFMTGIFEWQEPVITLTRVALLELVPLSLGAAIANTILRGANTQEAEDAPFPKDVAIFALGSLFFALPLAPTEEMPLMAAHAGWWRISMLVVASLLVTHLFLYELGFRGQAGRADFRPPRILWGETFMVYATALSVSALMLAGFGQFNGQPPAVWVQETVILGLPAALGGAAAQVVL